MHYLDNAATTRVTDEVADVADRVLRQHFANPSSLYDIGMESENVLRDARAAVAKSLGCTAAEIRFTASGTEGSNLAVRGAAAARRAWADHIVVTGYEHPCVQNTVAALEKEGWRVSVIPPDAAGHVALAALVDAVTPATALCTAMHVNNEVGSVQDVAALAAAVKAKNPRTAVHIDGVQAWGKVPVRLAATKIDTYAVSGHKVHAPKGIGALYVRRGCNLAQTLYGGHQEQGFRPGTENVAYAAAMAKAIGLLCAKHTDFSPLRAMLLDGVRALPGAVCNSPADAWPGIVNFSLPGLRSETLLHFLEERQVYVSSGSACSKGEPSHTLAAMGLARDRADSALRVSFSDETTPDDVAALLAALNEAVRVLQRAHS